MAMDGYEWLCMAMDGHVWLCMAMYGYVWLCTVWMCVWLCMHAGIHKIKMNQCDSSMKQL